MEYRINKKFVCEDRTGTKHLCRIIENPLFGDCEHCFLYTSEKFDGDCYEYAGKCSEETRTDGRDVCVQLIKSKQSHNDKT
jgi:hypothetical protein